MRAFSAVWTAIFAAATISCAIDSSDEEDFGNDDATSDGTQSGSKTRTADRIPWSGYFWSMAEAELARGWDDGAGRRTWTEAEVREFDTCLTSTTAACSRLLEQAAANKGRSLSPLMKFDLYARARVISQGGLPTMFTHAARWELDNHYIGNNTEHRYWDSRGYAGKCIGWALATMFHDEPTKNVVIDGIEFRPADIKGILAAIYNGAQFFVPEEMVFGTEVRAGSNDSAAYEDTSPDDFVRALMATIDKGKMLEADLDPGVEVWNHPIHKYKMKWQRRTSRRVDVTTTIYYANDTVPKDAVFSTDPDRPDLLSRTLTFELNVPARWNGNLAKATGGTWTGESKDRHPDVVILGIEDDWRKSIYEYRNTDMNKEVNFQLIKQVRSGRTWSPVVDKLLADYDARNR